MTKTNAIFYKDMIVNILVDEFGYKKDKLILCQEELARRVCSNENPWKCSRDCIFNASNFSCNSKKERLDYFYEHYEELLSNKYNFKIPAGGIGLDEKTETPFDCLDRECDYCKFNDCDNCEKATEEWLSAIGKNF